MCLTLDLIHNSIMLELPITTQDMKLVQELSPRTIVMEDGNIVADGTTMEILENEELLGLLTGSFCNVNHMINDT